MAQSPRITSGRFRHQSDNDEIAAAVDTEALIVEASLALQDLSTSAEIRIERAQAAIFRLLPIWSPNVGNVALDGDKALKQCSPSGPCSHGNAALTKRAMVRRRRLGKVSYTVSAESQPTLSPRQLMVLRLIGRGLSNKRIALELDIAPETVKTHAKNVLAKLKAQTRAEAIARATGARL